MPKRLEEYSVIGFYADNHQVWIQHVDAVDPQQAAWKACIGLLQINEWAEDRLSDLLVVDVIKGHHQGVLGNQYTLSGEELKLDPRDWAPRES